MDMPSYIVENADHSLTITLSRPYSFDGVERETITLREPTAGDQKRFLTSEKAGLKEIAALEAQMISALADGVSPKALDNLAIRDYKRVSAAYLFFLDSPEAT